MTPVAPTLERRLIEGWPASQWSSHALVLALSGGADSIALLRIMCALAPAGTNRMTIAHFNHGLRGADSDADEQFVTDLCADLGLRLKIGRSTTASVERAGDGLEAAAREARYQFLRQTAEMNGARFVVTAHTADDQVETILHHILRGTGLAGLAGIPRTRLLSPAVTLIRPLLSIRRHEILEYLAAQRQPFREDASNAELDFTRNRIRHELLPLLERDYAPGARQSLLRLATIAADAQRVIDQSAQNLADRCCVAADAESISLDCQQLATADKHLVREMLVVLWRRQGWPQGAMTFAHWNLIAEAAQREPPLTPVKFVLPGAVHTQRSEQRLTLSRSTAHASVHQRAASRYPA